ncbi:BZ3500_MvSof-1268-A1-R1_Chr9g10365 [Microbotryum saponariae]|uniref:BZ3500_MvSof-1268-A1-R1_Chr9g10365 protein n=1 Tax=Microbotryum saponariae TaxID=289078 RepID=A0A2X0K8B4_9BASI|nr:BZ3501_MvSof-1269-A2-R1_Chr9g10115 [Microbotryum saponariae]SCZ99974.1 BZ3500_MvSof-1268-A1-R1_Chr9g10365 [Microbotryum saponariae]
MRASTSANTSSSTSNSTAATTSTAAASTNGPLASLGAPNTSTQQQQAADFLLRAQQGLLTLIHKGNLDARPSRQTIPPPKVGSCTPCREAKAKCSGGQVCSRCMSNGLASSCEYPVFNKRGRKRVMTANMILLESIHRDIQATQALLDTAAKSPAHSHPGTLEARRDSGLHSIQNDRPRRSSSLLGGGGSSDGGLMDDDTDQSHGHEDPTDRDEPLVTVIESPLAILAHMASIKISGTCEADTGTSSATLEKPKDETPAASYFATGFYQARTDRDPLVDPVNLGLLTESEFNLLVNYYFDHLHAFALHLCREIHTPQFIRDVSPFLATALVYTVSAFVPTLSHLSSSLETHALYLSERIFAQGYKTLEIVQAYCLLSTWSPIEPNWGDDRRWSWIGQAIRIATEIRLDKPLTLSMHEFYKSVGRPELELGKLSEDRARSWTLLFVAETALCVSTGRLGAIQGPHLTMSFRSQVPSVEANDPRYTVCAMEHLHHIYAKALALAWVLKDEATKGDQGSRLRDTFNESWKSEMKEWERRWPHANGYVRLTYRHNYTILLSISLRFKGGPTRQIFEECRASGLETVRIATQWQGDSLMYANNFICVNIAYAATLVVRIEGILEATGSLDTEGRRVCKTAADLLFGMGRMRPTKRTLHNLHATRLMTLLEATQPTNHAFEFEPNPMMQNQYGMHSTGTIAAPPILHADPVQLAHAYLHFGGGPDHHHHHQASHLHLNHRSSPPTGTGTGTPPSFPSPPSLTHQVFIDQAGPTTTTTAEDLFSADPLLSSSMIPAAMNWDLLTMGIGIGLPNETSPGLSGSDWLYSMDLSTHAGEG